MLHYYSVFLCSQLAPVLLLVSCHLFHFFSSYVHAEVQVKLFCLFEMFRWSVNRQMKFEGGFQGRTNKLVDSCYTFWQGATVVLAQIGLFGPDSTVSYLLILL